MPVTIIINYCPENFAREYSHGSDIIRERGIMSTTYRLATMCQALLLFYMSSALTLAATCVGFFYCSISLIYKTEV